MTGPGAAGVTVPVIEDARSATTVAGTLRSFAERPVTVRFTVAVAVATPSLTVYVNESSPT